MPGMLPGSRALVLVSQKCLAPASTSFTFNNSSSHRTRAQLITQTPPSDKQRNIFPIIALRVNRKSLAATKAPCACNESHGGQLPRTLLVRNPCNFTVVIISWALHPHQLYGNIRGLTAPLQVGLSVQIVIAERATQYLLSFTHCCGSVFDPSPTSRLLKFSISDKE